MPHRGLGDLMSASPYARRRPLGPAEQQKAFNVQLCFGIASDGPKLLTVQVCQAQTGFRDELADLDSGRPAEQNESGAGRGQVLAGDVIRILIKVFVGYSFDVAGTVRAGRPASKLCPETAGSGAGVAGGLANRPSNPSAAVGWVQIASRRTVYGMPPSIAVWATAMSSLASAPNAVKPRMRSSLPISAFMKPRVCDSVCVRSTIAMGIRAMR